MGQFLETYGKEIFSLLVTVITWAIQTGMKPKVKLIWSSPHAFVFRTNGPPPVPPPGVPNETPPAAAIPPAPPAPTAATSQPDVPTNITNIFTASVRLYNGGREAAHNVEMVFNYKPMLHNVWPAREFIQSIAPDNRCTLKFATLSPGEELRIELLNVNDRLPELLTVRCDEQLAKPVPLRFSPAVSQWRIWGIQGLALIGLGSAVYWLIVLVQLLVLRTPSP